MLSDNTNARTQREDTVYVNVPRNGEKLSSQNKFLDLALEKEDFNKEDSLNVTNC